MNSISICNYGFTSGRPLKSLRWVRTSWARRNYQRQEGIFPWTALLTFDASKYRSSKHQIEPLKIGLFCANVTLRSVALNSIVTTRSWWKPEERAAFHLTGFQRSIVVSMDRVHCGISEFGSIALGRVSTCYSIHGYLHLLNITGLSDKWHI